MERSRRDAQRLPPFGVTIERESFMNDIFSSFGKSPFGRFLTELQTRASVIIHESKHKEFYKILAETGAKTAFLPDRTNRRQMIDNQSLLLQRCYP